MKNLKKYTSNYNVLYIGFVSDIKELIKTFEYEIFNLEIIDNNNAIAGFVHSIMDKGIEIEDIFYAVNSEDIASMFLHDENFYAVEKIEISNISYQSIIEESEQLIGNYLQNELNF